jgi:CxxC motif-containing protein
MVSKTKNNKLTCIICPVSCVIEVEHSKTRIKTISGHQCKKGKVYAKEELFNPTRTLTTTIPVEAGIIPLVSVRTDKPVPKNKIFSIMKEVMQLTLKAPVALGDVILKNVQGTGANIIATKTVERLNNRIPLSFDSG